MWDGSLSGGSIGGPGRLYGGGVMSEVGRGGCGCFAFGGSSGFVDACLINNCSFVNRDEYCPVGGFAVA